LKEKGFCNFLNNQKSKCSITIQNAPILHFDF